MNMHHIFEEFIHTIIHLLGMDSGTPLGKAVYFFIEEGIEIFVMLYFVIFLISLIRKHISPLKLREYVGGKNRSAAYLLAAVIGAFIPFCSCSAVPLFIGFVGAGIPLGVCMAFILASAVISEIGVFLIMGLAGWQVALIYAGVGIGIAYLGGLLADRMGLKKDLKPGAVMFEEAHHCNGHEHNHEHCACGHETREDMGTIYYAHHFAVQTIKDTWYYILIGVVLGACVQGFVPDDVMFELTNADNPLAVPFASVAGVLMYAPHGAVIPIFDALLQKGVPLGAAIVVLMSTVAISFPEFALLKKVMSFRLIAMMLVYLLLAFNFVGYLLN